MLSVFIQCGIFYLAKMMYACKGLFLLQRKHYLENATELPRDIKISHYKAKIQIVLNVQKYLHEQA